MNRRRAFAILGLCLLTMAVATRSEPAAVQAGGSIEVVNEAGKSVSLTMQDLAGLPQKEIKAKDRLGDEGKYAGVLVSDALTRAEVLLGEQLRGKLTNFLLVEAADDYRAVFSLPEVDPEFTDNVVLIATSRNGEPLDKAHGPFQLVLPNEKRHARWVRQITRMSAIRYQTSAGE